MASDAFLFDRRSLLKGTSLGLLAAALPSVGRAEELDAWEGQPFAVALAIAETLFGRMGDEFPSIEDARFADHLRDFLTQLDQPTRDDLVLLMRVVEWWPVLTGYFARFHTLDLKTRGRILDAWPDHWLGPLRMAATAIKLVFAPIYFADDATWAPIGYDGPWVDRFAPPYFELPPVDDDPPLAEILP